MAIPVKLVSVIIAMMMVSIITTAAVPIVRPVISVRIIVTVRIISVIARTEADTEVNLSVRTCRPCDHQTPSHDCN